MKKISFDANIVQFYGACTDETGAWLMMEYMEVSSCRSQSPGVSRITFTIAPAKAVAVLNRITCLCVYCQSGDIQLRTLCLPPWAESMRNLSRSDCPAAAQLQCPRRAEICGRRCGRTTR